MHSHIRRACPSYRLGVKNAVLICPRLFGLKMSTAGAFAVLFQSTSADMLF